MNESLPATGPQVMKWLSEVRKTVKSWEPKLLKAKPGLSPEGTRRIAQQLKKVARDVEKLAAELRRRNPPLGSKAVRS